MPSWAGLGRGADCGWGVGATGARAQAASKASRAADGRRRIGAQFEASWGCAEGLPAYNVRMREPRVAILGGGFGGLNAAKALRDAPVQVTLIDRRNHHLFQPLLYQVATAALNPSDIAVPIRSILRRQKNATVLLGEVVSVDAARRKVVLSDGEIAYDYLLLATDATHSHFGHDDWAAHA